MSAPQFKTKAEQKVEWLANQRAVRPLTEAEWQELGRAEHAVYVRDWRSSRLQQHRNEELELLAKVEAEAAQPDRGERR